MQSHTPQAYPEGLVCAMKAQAHLHPPSQKRSVVLEATNGWQLSPFFPFLLKLAGGVSPAKVMLFRST